MGIPRLLPEQQAKVPPNQDRLESRWQATSFFADVCSFNNDVAGHGEGKDEYSCFEDDGDGDLTGEEE